MLSKQHHAKRLPESIKTVAEWIQVKRYEKNLTAGQLAAKMGIATNLLRSWENSADHPNQWQRECLMEILKVEKWPFSQQT